MASFPNHSGDYSAQRDDYQDDGEEEYSQDEYNHSPHEIQKTHDDKPSNHALNLEWCLGFNFKLVNGVINLITEHRTQIFFVSGNTGVIYDYKGDKKQTLLQGHCNEITCVAYCKEQDIIVTADRGPSSMMVIWDVKTGTPRHSIFDPHPNGVQSLDITNDGRTIVTLSLEEKGEDGKYGVQTIKIWNYEQDNDGAYNYMQFLEGRIDRIIEKLPSYDYQKFIHIKKWNNKFEEFATTGEEKVYFWTVDKTKEVALKGYQPPNNSMSKRDKRDKKEKEGEKDKDGDKDKEAGKDKKSKYVSPYRYRRKKNEKDEEEEEKPVTSRRAFTQTVFIPNSSQAVTGTKDGHLVVWDISLILEDMTEPENRREIKTINLLNSSSKNDGEKVGISVLMSCPEMLVIGATNGHVKFYDYQFRIVGWFENDRIGEVTSISLCNKFFDFSKLKLLMKEDSYQFDYPDFIVVDKHAKIVEMQAKMFNDTSNIKDVLPKKLQETRDNINKKAGDPREGAVLNSDNSANKMTIILESIPGRVNSISSRPGPGRSQIALSCENGSIYEWDFIEKKSYLKKLKAYNGSPGERPSCLQYSPNGEHLIVATNQRNVYCYKVKKEDWQKNPLAISQKKNFVKGLYITFSENSDYFAIMDDQHCVSLYKLEKTGDCDWAFNGRLRSHQAEVNDICFIQSLSPKGDSTQTMLYSIGEDKRLVEYDVEQSRMEKLVYHPPTMIEHEVAPKACIWYPVDHLTEPVLMVATADYKIKLWNVRGEEKICTATFLGPTYGGPINKMLYLKREEEDNSKYVAYTTEEKIAGIIKLPLDGNPNKTMGMIAHPNKISSMTATGDGKFLFTCGYDDIGVVNMWFVNYSVIDEQEKMASAASNPLDLYPNLLEGGTEGQIYRDLKDFFYYTQINSNTDNPTKAKKLDGKIPYKEVPNLMRALGYYPTRQEALNMQNEVMHSKANSGPPTEAQLGLDTFVKLFINHRPVYGLTSNLIREKMAVLAKNGKYSKKDFIEDMTTQGDKFSDQQLQYFLNVLLSPGDINTILPDNLDANFMIERLLGMEDENEEEPAEFRPNHSN
jgi:WD40 repeat protein/Ca2+-binding EF-hand superfamily protein